MLLASNIGLVLSLLLFGQYYRLEKTKNLYGIAKNR